MDLWVVYDTSGAGRLVGVFDTAERARTVRAINPYYYRVERCRLNRACTDAADWLLEIVQRERLLSL